MSRILSARTRHLMDLSKTLSLESFDDVAPAAVVVEPTPDAIVNDIPAEPIIAAEDIVPAVEVGVPVVAEEGWKGAIIGTAVAGPIGGVAGHFIQEHAIAKAAAKEKERLAHEKEIRESARNEALAEKSTAKPSTEDAEVVSEEGVVGGAVLGGLAGLAVPIPGAAIAGAVVGGIAGHKLAEDKKHRQEDLVKAHEKEIREHERNKTLLELSNSKPSTEDNEVVSEEGVKGAVIGGLIAGPIGAVAGHFIQEDSIKKDAAKAAAKAAREKEIRQDERNKTIAEHYTIEANKGNKVTTEDGQPTPSEEGWKGAVAGTLLVGPIGGVAGHFIEEHIRKKKAEKAAAEGRPAVEDDVVVAPSEAPMIDEVDSVQDAIRDVNDSHQVIDELSEAAAGMEAIVASMEASLADGGLTPQASVFANLAINAHTHRVGYHRPVVASMESFGGVNTREQATTISCESAKEVIEKIWAAIKSALAAAWKAITEFYKRIFNEARRVKAAAKSLRSHVEELDGAPKKGEFELGDLAKRIAVNGKVPGNLTAGILSAHKAIDSVLTGFAAQAVKYTAEIRAVVVATATANEDTFEEKLNKLTTIRFPIPEGMRKSGVSGVYNEYTSAALPGDMVFKAYVVEYRNNEADIHLMSLANVKLEVRADGGHDVKSDLKLKVEPKGAMTTTLQEVEKLCDLMLDAEKHLDDNRKVLNDEAKSIKDDIADKVPEKHAMAFKNLLQFYGRAIGAADRIPTAVLGYGVQVSKAYLALVAKSAACYKEESKPEAAAA